jgi:uncharacterized NAD(P)/FAD-binding protein YdhS
MGHDAVVGIEHEGGSLGEGTGVPRPPRPVLFALPSTDERCSGFEDHEEQMKSFNIVIIGVGQRGLSILERFSAVVAHDPVPASLTVHLVDPAVPGQGIHESLQPDHLLINTIAGQCTLYTDKSVVGAGPIVEGRTFLDWARDKGYKKVKGKIVRADFGEQIDEHTYLSRAHLGEYLTWVYDKIVANLPSNVTILNHRRQATDIVRRHDQRLQVHLEGGFKIEADFVYLTTGHAGCGADATDLQYESWVEKGRSRNSHLAYFRIPYPISRMNSISSQAKVAICGAGLTTADVVSALTTGLGGVFESVSHDRYKYIPCGREPKITLFSRQGLPASGRAINQKGNAQYKAKFFLTKLTDTLRQRRGSRQLDWDRDLLPTLKREMAHVYDSVQKGEEIDPNGYQPTPEVVAAIEDLCAPLRRRSFVDHESFTRFIRAHLIQDIADCFEGNAQNPRKAASDMLRDIRDNIRYAVDYAGLTPESHAKFLSAWCSISNRISSGPPKERNMELLTTRSKPGSR